MTCKRHRHYFICYFCCFGVIAFSSLFALLVIFLHFPQMSWSKGDQIFFEKQKPYILYNQRPLNLIHFCREFRVIPRFHGHEYDAIIVQATTSRDRPMYTMNASTYSFTEYIYLEAPKTRNLSYYLPSSSRFDITTCGAGLTGDDNSLNIPIFNDHGKMKRWLNSNEQDPTSTDIILYAQFPPCPEMATVSLNTSRFPDGKWYFLLGTGLKYEEDAFIATLKLQFTKRLLKVSDPVDNCTANAEDYCDLEAPPGNDVFLLLEHSINSSYPYASWIYLACDKYDPFLSCMCFLVLPLGMSVCAFLFYCILVQLGCLCSEGSTDDNEPDLPGVMYCDAGTWRISYVSSRGYLHSSLPSIPPPDYDSAIYYPDNASDDGLDNNFSTDEINSDVSSLAHLSALNDLPTDVNAVTDPDNPPAYDTLSQINGRDGLPESSEDIVPPPGYETVLQLNVSISVSARNENPPSYASITLTQPGD